ncbi:MAG: AsmA protein [Candidatus Endobugula sp.]|jgi:AsmA protein
MKLIKIALSIVTLIIMLLVAAVILLPQFINPNDYRGQIAGAIKKNTGLEAVIDGNLSLSVFPWLGVSTGKIVLKQPAVIQQSVPTAGVFVDVEAVDIKIKLAPLFSRKVEIDTLILKQPRIEYIVNAKGQNSLSGLHASPASSSTAPTETTAPAHNATSIAALTIAGVNISDGQVIVDNKQTNTRYELTRLNIQSGNILEAIAPLTLSGELAGNTIQPVTLTLDSELQANKDTLDIIVNDFRVSVTQANNIIDIAIDSLTYQHARGLSELKDITVNATAEKHPLSVKIPAITVERSQVHARIPNFTVSSYDATLSGSVDIKDWNTLPMAIGQIESNTINLQQLLSQLGVVYTPTKNSSLTAVSFSTQFNATANGASLQEAVINIDATTLQGDAAIVNFSQPKYRFDLSLNSIIVDDYLPVPDDTNKDQQQSKPPTATDALAAPIILLKDIYANGIFKADKIIANKVVLTDNIIKVTSTNSTVTITPTINLYGGKLAGSTILQRGNTPTLFIKNTLTDVNLQPLLTDAEVTDQLSGIATINTNITVSEKSGKPLSKGIVTLLAKDGAIEGVNIKKVLDDAQKTIDKIRGKNIARNTTASKDATRFAEMTATLLIDNDIITNNDLSMKAPVFRINGQGSVNTAAQTLNYLTSIIVVNTNQGQGGEDLSDLKGFTIPVRFTGPLSSPKYTIDTTALLQANLGKQLDAKKAALKDKAEEEKAELKIQADKKKQELKNKAQQKLKESGKKLFDKLF